LQTVKSGAYTAVILVIVQSTWYIIHNFAGMHIPQATVGG
jgi:hypothetical protein